MSRNALNKPFQGKQTLNAPQQNLVFGCGALTERELDGTLRVLLERSSDKLKESRSDFQWPESWAGSSHP